MKKSYYERNKAKWRKYYATRRTIAPVYAAWRSMMTRCGYLKGAKPHEVKRYIGRGITICEEWRDYPAFEKWALTHGWERGLQIDRIDNDGNYEPSNCRFVTAERNSNNRSSCLMVKYHGKTMTLKDAYIASGSTINYKTVNSRVRIGWEVTRALTERTGK